jgi:hypothetical protein
LLDSLLLEELDGSLVAAPELVEDSVLEEGELEVVADSVAVVFVVGVPARVADVVVLCLESAGSCPEASCA